MTDIILQKIPSGALIPIDQAGIDFIAKLKSGTGLKFHITKARNIKFHRRYFALLNYAFDQWEPEEKLYKGQKVAKEFEQFRNDVTVLAGYYDTSITLKGEVRLTAKSISFANMNEDTFEKLYQATITVILERILTKYTRDDLDDVIEQLLRFA